MKTLARRAATALLLAALVAVGPRATAADPGAMAQSAGRSTAGAAGPIVELSAREAGL